MARESDLAYWLDVTADLLQRPLTTFPAADLAAHLNHTFEFTPLSWQWRETEDGSWFELLAGEEVMPVLGTLEDADGAPRMTHPRDDVDPDDLDLARRLLRLMAGLHIQVRARSSRELVSSGSAVRVELTGTESAVLSLLARGYTAHGIAGKLSNSPRTVHKHLEHIYRKLGVSDRLRAVQVAAELGLHAPGSTDQTRGP